VLSDPSFCCAPRDASSIKHLLAGGENSFHSSFFVTRYHVRASSDPISLRRCSQSSELSTLGRKFYSALLVSLQTPTIMPHERDSSVHAGFREPRNRSMPRSPSVFWERAGQGGAWIVTQVWSCMLPRGEFDAAYCSRIANADLALISESPVRRPQSETFALNGCHRG